MADVPQTILCFYDLDLRKPAGSLLRAGEKAREELLFVNKK
jgi:hypothetical protein